MTYLSYYDFLPQLLSGRPVKHSWREMGLAAEKRSSFSLADIDEFLIEPSSKKQLKLATDGKFDPSRSLTQTTTKKEKRKASKSKAQMSVYRGRF